MENRRPEEGERGEGEEKKKTPLESLALPPPLFAVSSSSSTIGDSRPRDLGWLCNTSFTTDLLVINDAVSSFQKDHSDVDEEEEDSKEQRRASYELVQEQEGTSYSDLDTEKDRKRKRKRKGRRKRSRDDFSSRKSNVRAWTDSDAKLTTKDYYFDAHGDRDNLVYGCLYRMDVPSYKPCNLTKVSGFGIWGLNQLNQMGSLFNGDGDVDGLDTQLKSGGRYWSANYVALERHKNLKRLRLRPPKHPVGVTSHNFIPLSDSEMFGEVGDDGVVPIVEESWEDEVFEKTREFNKLTRERPQDERLWLEFAEFQDKVANVQPQKGARLQTLEKKISILEKAIELNPESEELLIYLLNSYRNKDSSSVLIDRWEKVLMQHSGSYRLWKEYLGVLKREFSRFKVSDVRKMYAHAIQALSTSCNKLCRQVYQTSQSSPNSTLVQLELGLVDTFLDLCKFEWQAGYQELAIALLQAEIEYSLFCPPMVLSDRSKLRLFEHFWNSDGPRVGEEGAMGWSSWLEKEEENRQRIVNDKSSHDDDTGGWTGWSEPVSKPKDSDDTLAIEEDALPEKFTEENEEVNQEDDTAALLKQLGIDVDVGADCEIKDTATWARWSEEESSRDYKQWMPKHGSSDAHEIIGRDNEEPFFGAVLFEDVSEFLFSLNSREAQLSLLYQFIEFFGGEISQWASINSSKWSERILNLDTLPDLMMHNLRRVNDILAQFQSKLCGNFLEFLLGCKDERSKQVEMMKFLRNAILLCLNVLPRSYALQEAALSAEELSVSKMNSSSAIRALAKSLLKADRQDVLLCGVYAKKEAASGNIDHARRAFDMALSSVDGLSQELRSNAPILCFWYAEAELANSSRNPEQSICRALHILSSLGVGLGYSPFECKPSSLQILRAHQGFKERLNIVRSSWLRGAVDDQSLAVVCSAALFEELTAGWAAGVKIFDEAFAMVLPERRIHSHHLEFLFNYYVRMLLRCQNESTRSKVWESTLKGLEMYPSSSELFASLLEIGHLHSTTNKLRMMFDNYCHRNPSIVVWLYALLFEMSKGGSPHRIHGMFERALANERLSNSVILWRIYIAYEISIASNPSAARRVFFRAIHACPWSKKLWLDGFLKLNSILTPKELSDLQEVMRDKELNLRTDIFEILLQDDLV